MPGPSLWRGILPGYASAKQARSDNHHGDASPSQPLCPFCAAPVRDVARDMARRSRSCLGHTFGGGAAGGSSSRLAAAKQGLAT